MTADTVSLRVTVGVQNIERLSHLIEPAQQVKEKYLGLRNHYNFIQELIKVEVNKQL